MWSSLLWTKRGVVVIVCAAAACIDRIPNGTAVIVLYIVQHAVAVAIAAGLTRKNPAAGSIVMVHLLNQDALQMPGSQYDNVIQAFVPDRVDHSF